MKNVYLLFIALIMAFAGRAATNYGFKVGGVDVNSDNYSNVTGENIKANDTSKPFSVVYNPNTNVLTITNVNIKRTGTDNRALFNQSCTGLKVVFVGDNYFKAVNASALRANVNTTLSSPNGKLQVAGDKENAIYIANGCTLTIDDCEIEADCYYEGSSSTIEGNKGTEKIIIKNSYFYAFNQNNDYYAIRDIGSINVTSSYFVAINAISQASAFKNVKGFTISSDMQMLGGTQYNASSYSTTPSTGIRASVAVPIDAAHFPDATFRAYVDSKEVTDDNILALPVKSELGEIYADGYVSVSLYNKGITSLKGIEYLTGLSSLDCSSNSLTTLDLTKNTELTTLDVGNNRLTSLNLSKNTALTTLGCYNNQLTTLNLSNHKALNTLDCDYNQLTTLTLPTTTTLLFNISCVSNKLSSLSLSGCLALRTLNCNSNNLTSLAGIPSSIMEVDVTNNKFTTLTITGKPNLTKLNVSSNPSLTQLDCHGNSLSSLNIWGCTALSTLNCSQNKLTSLTNVPDNITEVLAGNNYLSSLTLAGYSKLTKLDVSNNTQLQKLDCSVNALTTMNISGCAALKTLMCGGNQLTTLSTLPPSLSILSCDNNLLSSLPSTLPSTLTSLSCNNNTISTLPTLPAAIVELYAAGNDFTTLSITGKTNLRTLNLNGNPLLTKLECYDNALTSLNVSACSHLKNLFCDGNQLTSLSNLPAGLVYLKCNNNQLTTLSVDGLSNLETLSCESNKLSELSVSGCDKLSTINCHLNKIKGTGMTTLVNSLRTIPAGDHGTFKVVAEDYSAEVNEITNEQVNVVRNKNWLPYKLLNGAWVEIKGTGLQGDVNGDGSVNGADVTALYGYLLDNKAVAGNPDVSGDGSVSGADVTALYNLLLK